MAGPGAPEARRKPDALALAYRFIVKRERTIGEVRARLSRAECGSEEVEAAIAELVALRYLDDARYAALYIADKRALEGWGITRIVRGLRERGVSEELIDAALVRAEGDDGGEPPSAGEPWDGRDRGGGDSELERAVAILVRRFPTGIGDERDYRRAFAVLARKGYDPELAGDAVRKHRDRCRSGR